MNEELSRGLGCFLTLVGIAILVLSLGFVGCLP